ncbi:MarR family transcriptional regulator [Clostridia bacterium OttesenSCG-928-O13]|nr:MarR family transcriptional regulator [Clostridia bacterium OttesenSCG-928-O13]
MPNEKKGLEQQVILSTIELMEQISNNKTNAVTLAGGATFYRGESHVLKIIGEEPGIFSSEIARRFSVTRAAVQKILARLEDRGLIIKKMGEGDKKKIQLYLTEGGREALDMLVAHQMQINTAFFASISTMTAAELDIVNRFLAMTKDVLADMQPKE